MGKHNTKWIELPFSNAARAEGQNVFTGSARLPRLLANAIITPYDAWKQLIHEAILRTITKCLNEEGARCGEEDFGLQELEVLSQSSTHVVFIKKSSSALFVE